MQLQRTISWNQHHTIMNIITLVRWIVYAWVMWQVATTPNYIFPMETIQTFGGAFAPLVWWACKYAHGVHRSSTMMKTSWPSFVPLSAHRCCASTICLHSDGDKDRRHHESWISSCSSIGPPFAAQFLLVAIVNLISYLQLLRLVQVKEERPLFWGTVYTIDVLWLHRV